MRARRALDAEYATWHDDGWVLLDGLVGVDEIDAAQAICGRCSRRPSSTTPIPTV